jgi:hypothetical protein
MILRKINFPNSLTDLLKGIFKAKAKLFLPSS